MNIIDQIIQVVQEKPEFYGEGLSLSPENMDFLRNPGAAERIKPDPIPERPAPRLEKSPHSQEVQDHIHAPRPPTVRMSAPKTQSVSAPYPEACHSLPELEVLAAGCHACPLHQGRQCAAFGYGNPNAYVMFVGDSPGYGRTHGCNDPYDLIKGGELLHNIVRAMHLSSSEVYITNLLKCQLYKRQFCLEGAAMCRPFLDRQIELIKPKVIVLLGARPLEVLLGKAPLAAHRGKWYQYKGVDCLVTFHPQGIEYMHMPQEKRLIWQEMKGVLARISR